MDKLDDQENIRRIHYLELIERLKKKYMKEGLSEFDARMKAVMSDESLSMVYPNGYDEDYISQLREAKESDETDGNGTRRL